MDTKGIALFEERMTKPAAGKIGFDPMLILAFITAILPMIQNCFNKSAANIRRKFGNRVRIAAAMRREVPGLSWTEAYTFVDRAYEVAADAKDEEIDAFVEECCR